jgi:hypothetical protein
VIASSRTTNPERRVPGCTHTSIYCNNCLVWALVWREKVIAKLRAPIQDGLALDFSSAA